MRTEIIKVCGIQLDKSTEKKSIALKNKGLKGEGREGRGSGGGWQEDSPTLSAAVGQVTN